MDIYKTLARFNENANVTSWISYMAELCSSIYKDEARSKNTTPESIKILNMPGETDVEKGIETILFSIPRIRYNHFKYLTSCRYKQGSIRKVTIFYINIVSKKKSTIFFSFSALIGLFRTEKEGISKRHQANQRHPNRKSSAVSDYFLGEISENNAIFLNSKIYSAPIFCHTFVLLKYT